MSVRKAGSEILFKQKKFLIGGIIILIAIGVLSYLAFKGAATYYYTVGEAVTQSSTLAGQNIRVAGRVVEGSLVLDKTTKNVSFKLIDTTDATKTLPIYYTGALPDAFKEGNDAVVEGQLSSEVSFKATQIIVKCPSKYVPKE
jgi:cytochrome c-type biogenesis protein CcmE